jgi:hypothetical protein
MPVAFFMALAASLGLHVAMLLGPEITLATEPETQPLWAELKPLPKSLGEAARKPPAARKKNPPAPTRTTAAGASAVMRVPAALTPAAPEAAASASDSASDSPAGSASEASAPHAEMPPPEVSRLPDHGRILYRVDRGDMGFEIGKATSEWDIDEGHYRLRLETETTGLVWLLKSYRIVMESEGRIASDGLRPERFSIRRNGADAGENAAFDWEQMLISVGNSAPQRMSPGAQDLLSFNYQLGFMPSPEVSNTLPITTGKKYGIYRLESLGDEQIETPAGVMRTLHLRAPGTNTTELWLAYDYLLLPVKIRHTDDKGDSFVQVALHIQLSPK